ncbi:MAG: hypothetical protein KDD40_04565 [Bdellovibrionales bacterium]|nr:hypothetical protein [Bdellovibrionales bacterium]
MRKFIFALVISSFCQLALSSEIENRFNEQTKAIESFGQLIIEKIDKLEVVLEMAAENLESQGLEKSICKPLNSIFQTSIYLSFFGDSHAIPYVRDLTGKIMASAYRLNSFCNLEPYQLLETPYHLNTQIIRNLEVKSHSSYDESPITNLNNLLSQLILTKNNIDKLLKLNSISPLYLVIPQSVAFYYEYPGIRVLFSNGKQFNRSTITGDQNFCTLSGLDYSQTTILKQNTTDNKSSEIVFFSSGKYILTDVTIYGSYVFEHTTDRRKLNISVKCSDENYLQNSLQEVITHLNSHLPTSIRFTSTP